MPSRIDRVRVKIDALRNDAARLCARVDAVEPYLRSAIKHKGKLYIGSQGEYHGHVVKKAGLDPQDDQGEPHVRGFVNHKGHFIDRYKAMDYAQKHGLVKDGFEQVQKRGEAHGPILHNREFPFKSIRIDASDDRYLRKFDK
jgi:hypothetical protein